MRHPFYMDQLGSQDRKNVKWLMVRVLAGYLSLGVLVVGGAMVKAKMRPIRRPNLCIKRQTPVSRSSLLKRKTPRVF